MTDEERARAWLDENAPHIPGGGRGGRELDIAGLAELLAAVRREAVEMPYHERNMLVGVLSKMFPAWLAVDPNEPDWPVVLIDLPTGQVSWHVTALERYSIFSHLDDKPGPKWDGHDDVEKWRRVCTYTPLREGTP